MIRLWFLGAVVVLSGSVQAVAQPPEGNRPPVITSVTYTISRYTASGYQVPVVFNPAAAAPDGLARERDLLAIVVHFSDADLVKVTEQTDPNGNVTIEYEPGEETFFARKQSLWVLDAPDPPEPPSVQGDTWGYIAPPGLAIDAFPATTGQYSYSVIIPEWTGASQARLRDPVGHPYDVGWTVTLELCNAQAPTEQTPRDIRVFDLQAVENPALRPSNPPPSADAGADQVAVLSQSTGNVVVTLDGSRTYDGWNVGFDPLDPEVFEKDNLHFTWEWLSGPVRVDPVDNGDADPATAQVTLQTPSTSSNPYVYRLLVTDDANPVPSTDSMMIHVRTIAPINQAPQAVAAGPSGNVQAGSIIELSGSGSTDPDSDQLLYRWRQTNEVGGKLATDQLATAFQPMSGMEAAVTRWRAVAAGTYFFRLTVTDRPELRDSALFNHELADSALITVRVVGSASGSGSMSALDQSADLGPAAPVVPGACGAGLVTLTIVPLALLLVRGRIR